MQGSCRTACCYSTFATIIDGGSEFFILHSSFFTSSGHAGEGSLEDSEDSTYGGGRFGLQCSRPSLP